MADKTLFKFIYWDGDENVESQVLETNANIEVIENVAASIMRNNDDYTYEDIINELKELGYIVKEVPVQEIYI